MPNNEEEITEEKRKIIEDLIEEFKEKIIEDAASISTGNEVKGHTHHDEFINNCIQHTNSPAACESAWQKFMAQGKPAGKKIEKETGGHEKTPAKLEGDFQKLFQDLIDRIDVLEKDKIAKDKRYKIYEDHFQADLKKKEMTLKDKFKLPFSEETQKLVEDLTYDDLKKFDPLINKLFEEHPEIVPTTKSTNDLQEIGTNRILKMLGKDREDLRQKEDMLTSIKKEAEARMDAKWGSPHKEVA